MGQKVDLGGRVGAGITKRVLGSTFCLEWVRGSRKKRQESAVGDTRRKKEMKGLNGAGTQLRKRTTCFLRKGRVKTGGD